jgi:hypothetical protein
VQQALHIFRKDVRYLWKEIILLSILASVLGWAETRLADTGWMELLVVLAANFVIARVVHAEAIPGDDQFWITRPYRWSSLAGAKLLFVILFFNVPLCLAQLYAIVAGNFPFSESLAGLLWSVILSVVCVSVPVAAVATLTEGPVPFLLAEFAMLTTGFVGSGLLAWLVRARTLKFIPPITQPGQDASAWVRNSLVLSVIAGVGAFTFYTQYRNRRTNVNRSVAIAGAAVAYAIFVFTPWSFALGVQSMLSGRHFDESRLTLSLGSVKTSVFPDTFRGLEPEGEVSIPIAIGGIPDGLELRADSLSITVEGAEGRTWRADAVTPNSQPDQPGAKLVDAYMAIDPLFFRDESMTPVALRVKLYLTLFGNARSKTIPIQGEPVNAIDGLQCGIGLFNQLYCRSIFRWPRRLVSVTFGNGGSAASVRSISYSPFPASLELASLEQHSFSTPGWAKEVTVTTKEPVSHFWYNGEIRGALLKDFTRQAKRDAMRAPTVRTPATQGTK